jgi:hypothetical protein
MDVFDQVIHGLKDRGAFDDVPVPDGVVLPHEFENLKPAGNFPFPIKWFIFRHGENVPQSVSDYQFKNNRAALEAYMPQDVFLPWLRKFTMTTVSAPLPDIMVRLMELRSKDIEEQMLVYRQSENKPSTHPGLAGIQDAKKHNVEDIEVASKALQSHPDLLAAMTVFQASHLEFLCGIAQRLQSTQILNDDQKVIANQSLLVLSRLFSTNNFISPIIDIANAYHHRVDGDYTKPFEAEDFMKGWNSLYKGRSFVSNLINDDGSTVVVRCPFKSMATTESARIAGDEICPADRHSLRQSMGYGLWCLYQVITKSDGTARHESTAHKALETGIGLAENKAQKIDEKPYETKMRDIIAGKAPHMGLYQLAFNVSRVYTNI